MLAQIVEAVSQARSVTLEIPAWLQGSDLAAIASGIFFLGKINANLGDMRRRLSNIEDDRRAELAKSYGFNPRDEP